MEERCNLPSGVRGKATAANTFLCISSLKIVTFLVTFMQLFFWFRLTERYVLSNPSSPHWLRDWIEFQIMASKLLRIKKQIEWTQLPRNFPHFSVIRRTNSAQSSSPSWLRHCTLHYTLYTGNCTCHAYTSPFFHCTMATLLYRDIACEFV